MQKDLVIEEYISAVWKKLMVISFLVAIIFLVLLLFADDPLWKGIFRLTAFAGFAALVLAYLQTRSRIPKIKLRIDDDHLTVEYHHPPGKSREELFELKTIANIEKETAPAAWKVLPRPYSAQFIISFTDSKKRLSLFRFEGRDILISEDDARRTTDFLRSHLPRRVN